MKYYAIKKPEPAQVVLTWSECEALVKGKTGAVYKSFSTLKEAQEWAGIVATSNLPMQNGLRIYVDGSFFPDVAEAGWAWVAIDDGVEVARGSGKSSQPALSRNIDGECEAAYRALLWANEQSKIATICHDYEGVAKWALCLWKANSEIAKWYQEKVLPLVGKHKFEKVKAHSGDPWNELVDQLAKGALGKV